MKTAIAVSVFFCLLQGLQVSSVAANAKGGDSIYSITSGMSYNSNSLTEKILEKLPSSLSPGVTLHLTSHLALKIVLKRLLSTGEEREVSSEAGNDHLIKLSLNGALMKFKYSF